MMHWNHSNDILFFNQANYTECTRVASSPLLMETLGQSFNTSAVRFANSSVSSPNSPPSTSREVLIVDTRDTAAAEKKRKRKKKAIPKSRTVFRVWAHVQMKYGVSISLIIFGLLAMHYGAAERVVLPFKIIF